MARRRYICSGCDCVALIRKPQKMKCPACGSEMLEELKDIREPRAKGLFG